MTSKVTLPIVMLASGVANTVLSKYQDLLAEENGPVKSVAIFQSLNIFMGEACLWFYVIWNRWKNRFGYAPVKPLTTGQKMSMAIPAFMDICGSTLMNVGLLFTSASVYQMTRGSLIIFVALFSMLFLQKRLTLQRWLCLAFVVLGVAIVGYSGSSVNAGVDPTLGLVAILVGQMFLATQFTVEEYLLSSIDIEPNEVVAYEGTFGVIFVLIIMVVSYIFVGRTPEGKNGWFDFTHVFHRFNEEPMLYVISGVILISIAFFNASGLAITKLFSATTRSLLDIARTFGIWIIALIMGMESFHLLQLIGFTILIYGILTYHDILPFLNVRKKESVV